jgi:hypothetical protein
MTSKPTTDANKQRSLKGRGVLDPAWEEMLERGRDADEDAPDAGSIEPELAMLHLLRHAREPEAVNEQELDAMWSDISTAVAPSKSGWLARVGAAFSGQWARWLIPVAGAAAVVLIFQTQGAEDFGGGDNLALNEAAEPSVDSAGGPTAQDAERARDGADGEKAKEEAPPAAAAAPKRSAAKGDSGGASTAVLLEQQFTMLEARGRAKVDSSVQTQRTSLRSALIGQAQGGAK